MNAVEFMREIQAECSGSHDINMRTLERRRIVNLAMRRAMSEGLAYQATRNRQGFEDRPPLELVRELEEELADVVAWWVALLLRLEAEDIPVPNLERVMAPITDLGLELAHWRTLAVEAR